MRWLHQIFCVVGILEHICIFYNIRSLCQVLCKDLFSSNFRQWHGNSCHNADIRATPSETYNWQFAECLRKKHHKTHFKKHTIKECWKTKCHNLDCDKDSRYTTTQVRITHSMLDPGAFTLQSSMQVLGKAGYETTGTYSKKHIRSNTRSTFIIRFFLLLLLVPPLLYI